MSWESVEAIAAVAAAVVAISAVWQQNNAFRVTLTADLALRLESRFASEEYKKIRARAARVLKSRIAEDKAEDAFDFFELVGLLTRRKALDAEVVHSLFFHWINVYWTAGLPHISRSQKLSKSLWKDFGYLYLKVLEIEKREDPNSQDISLSERDLNRYLDDEISLDQNHMLVANAPSDSQTSEDQL